MISLETAKKLAALHPDKFGTMMGALWFDQFDGNPDGRGTPIVQFDKDGNVIPNRHREQQEGMVLFWMLQSMREAYQKSVNSKLPSVTSDGPLYELNSCLASDLTPETIVSIWIEWQDALAEETKR